MHTGWVGGYRAQDLQDRGGVLLFLILELSVLLPYLFYKKW